jgi:hypothetical protein
MHQMVFQRICAWSGMVCVSLFFGAFALMHFVPPISPGKSAAQIAHHYQDHTNSIRFGALLMLLSSMFYAAFTALISAQMRRMAGIHHVAIYTQLAAGAFACLTFLVPGLIFEVAAFRPDRDPSQTLLLNDMGWIFMVMPWMPFLTQNWTFAYAILTDEREKPVFPRWLAYCNIWAIIIFSPAVALPFFKSGVFAWNGLFVVWIPAFVFIAQFVVNTWALLRAIGGEEQETRALAGSPRGSVNVLAPAPAVV